MSALPPTHGRRRWGKGRRARAAEAPEKIREEVAEVKELLLGLERLDKSWGLYPSGSAVLKQQVDDVHTRLSNFLSKVHAMELSIAGDEIEYEGEVVYDASKSQDRNNLAFTLEDGGVRRLVFLFGIERAELQGFCEALKMARQPDADDLPTLLWTHGLRHVSYLTVNFYAETADQTPIEELLQQSTRATIVDRLRNREIGIDQIASVRSDRPPDAEDMEIPEIFSLAATESSEIQRRIAEFQGDPGYAPYCRLILSLLMSDRSEESCRVHLTTLQETLGILMEEGNVATGAEVVQGVRRLSEGTASYGQSRTIVVALRGFVAAAAKKELGARMADHLAKGRIDLKAVIAYLRALGKHAIYVASELLGGANDAKVIETIAQGCRTDYAHIRDFVADPNPRLAAAAVRILSEVAGDNARVDFIKASQHPDPGVRREAFIGLASCKDARAWDRLLSAFEDADPDIRLSALRAFLAVLLKPRPELYGRVLALVEGKTFAKRPAPEQDALFAILGRLDPEKGVPYLTRELTRWALFRRALRRRLKLAAAWALGEVASPEAEEILRRFGETSDEDIAHACRAALDRLELVRLSSQQNLDREKQGYEPDRSGAVKAFDRSGSGKITALDIAPGGARAADKRATGHRRTVGG
jgi:hypothetical protein